MCILSDKEITEYIVIKELAIENFNLKNLTPNGYDLTIAEISIPKLNLTIKQGIAEIPPLTFFAISTKEYLKLGPKITAQLWLRTSWARKGIIGSFGKIDCGFEGNLTLLAFNCSEKVVQIEIGKTFAQVIFERMSRIPEKLYAMRSGDYQGQRGITFEKE